MASERSIMNWVRAGSSPPRSVNMSAKIGMMNRTIPISTSHGEHADQDRVDHRRAHRALEVVVLLQLDRDALQHLLQVAAGLAGAHHGDEEVREDLGVLRHGLGERQAGLDVLAHGDDRVLELGRLGLLLEHVERAQQGEAARDHGGQLARHDRDVARLEAAIAVEELLDGGRGGLLVHVHDREAAQAQLGRDRRLRVAGDLPREGAPRAVEGLVDERGAAHAAFTSPS